MPSDNAGHICHGHPLTVLWPRMADGLPYSLRVVVCYPGPWHGELPCESRHQDMDGWMLCEQGGMEGEIREQVMQKCCGFARWGNEREECVYGREEGSEE